MEHGSGLFVLCALTTLTACAAALPERTSAGAMTAGGAHLGQTPIRPLVRVDTLVPSPRPAVSLNRSPVLDRALGANSNAAIIMFLLTRPDDPFADMARTSLNARQNADTPQALHAAAGADADLVAAFDAARLAHSDAAWTAFLFRFGDTPLAAEVPRFR